MRSNPTPSALAFTTLALVLAGCSSSSQPASPAAQPAAQPAAAPEIFTAKTAFWPMIGIGGRVTSPPLPHHRTCGSASGGSRS